MSKLSEHTYNLLVKIFPHNIIGTEHYVRYKGTRLFFDFFIKDLDLLFEVQGRQHYEFVKHFHGDKEGFIESKRRDNLKKEYCEENKKDLIIVNKELSATELSRLIWRTMNAND